MKYGLILLLLAIAAPVAAAPPYAEVEAKYSKTAPEGFKEFCRRNGNAEANSCAVRMAHALFLHNKDFFRDVEARSGVEWFGLPTRADDLAIVLNQKLGAAKKASKQDLAGHRGIIFFDKIPGFAGTGHISMWDGTEVVDKGDYFDEAERVYFWALK